MLTPCAPPGAKRHWNEQSQNSFFTVISSGGRSSSAGCRKKQPALSFSAGQPPSIPTPVKLISRKSVRNRVVFPSCSKGTPSQKAILSQPRTPFFFCGGIEFYIARFPVPELRVDAQHGPERGKTIRQERPKPVLLHAVGHQNCSTFIVLSLSIQCFPAAQNNAPARRQTGAQRLPQPQRSARRAAASYRTRAYSCDKHPVSPGRLRLEDCQNSGQFPHKTVRCPPQRNMQAEDLQNPPPCSHKTPVALSVAVRSESSSAGILPCAAGMRIVRTRTSRSGSINRIAAPFFVRKHQLNRSW